ncbi:MAG TPA: hypothetical protein VIX86_04680, partial [Streptosporangiaceae bacterium]
MGYFRRRIGRSQKGPGGGSAWSGSPSRPAAWSRAGTGCPPSGPVLAAPDDRVNGPLPPPSGPPPLEKKPVPLPDGRLP